MTSTFFATGNSLAEDTGGVHNAVDEHLQPGTVTVWSDDIPNGASVPEVRPGPIRAVPLLL